MKKTKSNPNLSKFFEENAVFTTTKAGIAGLTRRDLRSSDDIVCLGSFPVRFGDGKRFENIWTKDAELVNLIKQSKKARNKVEMEPIVNQIETIVRGKLGFDLPKPTEESNVRNNEDGSTTTEETPSETSSESSSQEDTSVEI